MATKRKRNELDLSTKIKLINDIESGMKRVDAAKKYGVGKSTVFEIIQAKDKWRLMASTGAKFRVLRSRFTDINKLMLTWVKTAKEMNIPISGSVIQAKASQFAEQLNINDFKASSGWLSKWKKRNGISLMTGCGAGGDANPAFVIDWKTKIAEMHAGYEPHNIFGFVKIGLCFKALPDRTPNEKTEGSVTEIKFSNDRVTVMLTCSLTGEKLKPMVIVQSEMRHCLKDIKEDQLPVLLKSNYTAWMTGTLFDEYLTFINCQMKFQNRKIVLFSNLTSSYIAIEKSNIKREFLPANVTSVLKPFEQELMKAFKSRYRRKLMRTVEAKIDESHTALDVTEQITVLDAIKWIAAAWCEIPSMTITKGFKNCGFDCLTTPTMDTDDNVVGEEATDLVKQMDDEVDSDSFIMIDERMVEDVDEQWEAELIESYGGDSTDVQEETVEKADDSDLEDGRNISYAVMLCLLDKVKKGITAKGDETMLMKLQELTECIEKAVVAERMNQELNE